VKAAICPQVRLLRVITFSLPSAVDAAQLRPAALNGEGVGQQRFLIASVDEKVVHSRHTRQGKVP
jgi:hypothetical protein